ncbi:MAG: hypothetical protein K0R83_2779 [Caulobacter sp.]|jgi:hypothetical protein|nr:hypothetical protein [Caulobacter sp.]
MSFRRQKRRVSGAGAHPLGLPAILAVLALLMQALAPGLAMAQPGGGTRTMVLCTSAGEQTVTLPDDSAPRPLMSHSCHDCVMAAVTTVAPPSAETFPVRYAAVVRHERAAAPLAAPPARPPPRPPSQGPPAVS